MIEANPTYIFAILGIIFLILELFVSSFFFLFLGVGALLTAILSFYGIIDSWPQDILVFAVTSIGSFLLFRKQLIELFHRKSENYNETIGDKALVSQHIPSNGEGKVFYRGSDWIAYSENNKDIKKGEYVTIKKIDGIKLVVD